MSHTTTLTWKAAICVMSTATKADLPSPDRRAADERLMHAEIPNPRAIPAVRLRQDTWSVREKRKSARSIPARIKAEEKSRTSKTLAIRRTLMLDSAPELTPAASTRTTNVHRKGGRNTLARELRFNRSSLASS